MTKQKRVGKSAMQKLGEYKMEIINRCLSSEELTKLIAIDSPDALFADNLSEDAKNNLVHSKIYPYRFVPEATESVGTYLTIGVGGFRRHQEGYKIYDDYQSGEVYFHMFTQNSIMRTHSGVRQDLMLAEIDKLFEGTRGLGIGQLKLRSLNELWMHNNKFGGYSVGFTIVDFK